MKNIILILSTILFTSCLGESLYRKRLYSGYLEHYTFTEKRKRVKRVYTGEYMILEKAVVHGKEYEVILFNEDVYYDLRECNRINSRREYVKFMSKNHKRGTPLVLDTACFYDPMFYVIDPEACKDMDIDPYDYIDEYNMFGADINDKDSVYCMIRKLLLSENLFIEDAGESGQFIVRKSPRLENYRPPGY